MVGAKYWYGETELAFLLMSQGHHVGSEGQQYEYFLVEMKNLSLPKGVIKFQRGFETKHLHM